MSDSLLGTMLTNLKNKATYKAFNAVTDPNANDFASKQTVPLLPPSVPEKAPDESTDGDPDTFSASRFMKKIKSQSSSAMSSIFLPIVALILSMYVTNEMIMYSAPIRLIFFIFTFLICFLLPPFLFFLAMYYLCRWGYGYYLSQLSSGPKVQVMPTIFALLPLTTTIPTSSLGAFFMYPFTYPKNDRDAKRLPIIMNDYMESLKKAFTYFDKVQNLPFIAEGFKTLKDNMEHLHEVPIVAPSEPTEVPLPPTLKEASELSKPNEVQPTVNRQNAPVPPPYNEPKGSNAPMPPTVNQPKSSVNLKKPSAATP